MREEEALRQLGAAQRLVREAVEKRDRLTQQKTQSLQRREQLGEKVTFSVSFITEDLFLAGTKQKLMQAETAIKRAERGVEKALQFYLHAKRQLMVIEKLRERDFSNFKISELKRELKQMDDLYVMRSALSGLAESQSILGTESQSKEEASE